MFLCQPVNSFGTSRTVDVSAYFVHLAEGPVKFYWKMQTCSDCDCDWTPVNSLDIFFSACGKELRSRVTDQKARNLSSIGLQWSPMVSMDRIQSDPDSYSIHDGTGWKMVENGGNWWKMVETEPLKIKTILHTLIRCAQQTAWDSNPVSVALGAPDMEAQSSASTTCKPRPTASMREEGIKMIKT